MSVHGHLNIDDETIILSCQGMVHEIDCDEAELVCEGLVKVIVGAKYPLRDAAQAHKFVESRASHGKVLLTV